MHYLFDFDGTLVDSMPYWAGVHIDMLKASNIPCPKDFVETITPLGNTKAAIYTIGLGLNITLDEYLATANKVFELQYGQNIPLKSGVYDCLTKLKKEGHTLNVLTASPHKFLDVCLKRNGIFDLFHNVWSIDDFCLTKDNPEIYLQAAKRLNTTPENCVFFDDNFLAICTAKKAGLFTVGVFDESAKSQTEKIKEIADKFIYSFDEI